MKPEHTLTATAESPWTGHRLTDEDIAWARGLTHQCAGKWRIPHDSELVEEMVAAAWFALVKAAERYDASWPNAAAFRGYAYMTIVGAALAAAFPRRRRFKIQATASLFDRSPSPSPGPADIAEARDEVRRVMEAAPQRMRRALAHIGRGFTTAAAARRIGISKQAVSYGLKRLRLQLEASGREAPE